MATVGANYLTLSDLKSRISPDGRLDDIVEAASRTNHMLMDMPIFEGNKDGGNSATVRSGLPAGTFRKLYQGVPFEKGSTYQVEDSLGMLESYALVDKRLWRAAPNPNQFRMDEESGFVEGMMSTWEDNVFYGDTDVNPERILGLHARYSDTSAENGVNIIDNGGTGSDLTSLWLVTWGYKTCFGFYGKGANGGFEHQDLGEDRVQDASGNSYQALVSHFAWELGLQIKDWRYIVRIANIESDGSTNSNLLSSLIKAVHRLPRRGVGMPVIYGNSTALEHLDNQRTTVAVGGPSTSTSSSSGFALGLREWEGEEVMTFRGIPIHKADAILDTESQIT